MADPYQNLVNYYAPVDTDANGAYWVWNPPQGGMVPSNLSYTYVSNGALYFTGTNLNRWEVPASGGANMLNQIGLLATPWTLEFDFKATGRIGPGLVPVIVSFELSVTNRMTIAAYDSGGGGVGVLFYTAKNGTAYQLGGPTGLAQNTWHRIALVNEGNATLCFYGNGTKGTPATIGSQYIYNGGFNYCLWGSSVYFTDPFQGYMRMIRFTSGLARYTASYTPAAFEWTQPTPKVGGQLILPRYKPIAPPAGIKIVPPKAAPGILYCSVYPGPGYVAGTVKEGSVLKSRTVRLYDRATGKLVASTISAADGSYLIQGVDPSRQYIAMAIDDDAGVNYDPAAIDRVAPARLYF